MRCLDERGFVQDVDVARWICTEDHGDGTVANTCREEPKRQLWGKHVISYQLPGNGQITLRVLTADGEAAEPQQAVVLEYSTCVPALPAKTKST